jgi:hypothetical protein
MVKIRALQIVHLLRRMLSAAAIGPLAVVASAESIDPSQNACGENAGWLSGGLAAPDSVRVRRFCPHRRVDA